MTVSPPGPAGPTHHCRAAPRARDCAPRGIDLEIVRLADSDLLPRDPPFARFGYTALIVQSRHPGLTPAAWLVAASLTAHGPACALAEGIDKVSKIPGLEEAQARQGFEKTPARWTRDGLSVLQASPPSLDFGRVPLYSQHPQTVTISNPSVFAVTVVRMSVEGCGFALSRQAPDRPIIAPQEHLSLSVIFQPVARRACTGRLLVEIDSAGGRWTEVVLKGRGV